MGVWSLISGTGTIQDSSLANTLISDLLPGTTVLRWSVEVAPCPVVYDDVTIHVDEFPSNAYAGEDQLVCDTSFLLHATVPVTGTGEWSLLNGDGVIEVSLF